MSGDVASATLSFIIRDHDKTQFENRLQKLRDITTSLNQKYGTDTITLEIEHSYENMLSVIENQMEIVNLAKQAISVEGLTPLSVRFAEAQMAPDSPLWDCLVQTLEPVVMVFMDLTNISLSRPCRLLCAY